MLEVGRAREHDNLSALREELESGWSEDAHTHTPMQGGARGQQGHGTAFDRLRQRFERGRAGRRQAGPPLVKTSAASMRRMNELRASAEGDATTTASAGEAAEKNGTVNEEIAKESQEKEIEVEEKHLQCPPTLVTYSRKGSPAAVAAAAGKHHDGEQSTQHQQHQTDMTALVPVAERRKETNNFAKQAARGCFEFDDDDDNDLEEIESTQEEVEQKPVAERPQKRKTEGQHRIPHDSLVRPICLDTPDIIEVDEKDSDTTTDRTPQQQRVVCTFMKNTPQQISVTKSDMERLEPEGELNDTLIDFYCTYLSTEVQDNEFFFCTTFLTKAVLSGDRDKVARLTRSLGGVGSKSFVVMPINLLAHWTVAIVCLKADVFADISTPCILFFDSLGGTEIGFDPIRRWLADMTSATHNCGAATMPVRVVGHLPRQENGTDCGVFVLQYIECFITRRPRTLSEIKEHWFSKAEIPEKRAYIRRVIETVDSDGRATVHLPLVVDEDDSDDDEPVVTDPAVPSDGRTIFLEQTPPSSLGADSSSSDFVSEEEPPSSSSADEGETSRAAQGPLQHQPPSKKQHTTEAPQETPKPPPSVRQRRCIVSDSEDET